MRQNRQRYQRRTGRLCARLTAALLTAVMLFTMQGVCTLASTTKQVSENDAGNANGTGNANDPGNSAGGKGNANGTSDISGGTGDANSADQAAGDADNPADEAGDGAGDGAGDANNNDNTDNIENADDSKDLKDLNDPNAVTSEVAAGTPANPVHNCTKEDDGTDSTAWSYVYFSSYPQSEVTDAGLQSAIDSAIASSALSSSGEGIDVWVDGTKYRRISADDCNNDYYFDEVPNDGYRYFKWERMKWRVLRNDGSTLFVAADRGMDCKDYNEEYTDVTWETCSLRNWLNGAFYHTAFSSAEQGAVVGKTVINADNPVYDTEGGSNTVDKVFLLSIDEVTNAGYGFCSDADVYSASRRMQVSDYARARGCATWNNEYTGYRDTCWWWLRSPGDYSTYAAGVGSTGFVSRSGGYVSSYSDAVVPALQISLSSDLWSMADDGTSGEGGGSGGFGTVSTPVPSKRSGSFSSATKLTLSTATAGARIYYTIDGSKPGRDNGTLYTGPITLKDSVTVKAAAVKEGMTDSEIMEEIYTFQTETAQPAAGSISIGGDKSGDVGDKEFVRFFPGDFKLASDYIPFSYSVSTKADGSSKIKYAIGIGRTDWLDDETEWVKYKKNVENASKSIRRYECLEGFSRQYNGKKMGSLFSTSKFKKKPQVQVLGYYEVELDKNGYVVKESGMVQGDAKWKAGRDWMFLTPIGPMYLELEGSGKLTMKAGLAYRPKEKSLELDGSIVLTPGISLEGGYGLAKVATIGAKGSAEFPIQFVPGTKLEVEAKASVHAYVVFVLDCDWTLAKFKKTLWEAPKKNNGSGGGSVWSLPTGGALQEETAAKGLSAIRAKDLSPVDRSYTAYTGAWRGGEVPAGSSAETAAAGSARAFAGDSQGSAGSFAGNSRGSAGSADGTGMTETVLQSGIMPNSLPLIRADRGGQRDGIPGGRRRKRGAGQCDSAVFRIQRRELVGARAGVGHGLFGSVC